MFKIGEQFFFKQRSSIGIGQITWRLLQVGKKAFQSSLSVRLRQAQLKRTAGIGKILYRFDTTYV